MLAVCLYRGDEAIYRPSEHLWMSDMSQKQTTVKQPGQVLHQYLSELLANMYSYCVMAKSMSCCRVRESWFFSNPFTCINAAIKLHMQYNAYGEDYNVIQCNLTE